MRLRLFLPLFTVVVVACGTMDTAVPADASSTSSVPSTTTTLNPTSTTEAADSRPVWEGFEATNPVSSPLAAYAHGPLDVYAQPGAPEPDLVLEHTTIVGTVTVLAVVSEPENGWVEVMLPIRPNGSTGWVESDRVSLFVANSRIVVDLGERRLTYIVDDVEVLATEVGIGSRYNETPTGEFFVTDSVTLSDPNSAWGPHALGLSARSESITEFNGGDGIIGIHGTNNPSSIGSNISLGCVRLPNENIAALHAMVPLGTRVEIRA